MDVIEARPNTIYNRILQWFTYKFSAYNESNGFSLGENDQLYRYLLITDASNKPKVKHQNYDQNYEKYCNLL